jgi:hypothetical protein
MNHRIIRYTIRMLIILFLSVCTASAANYRVFVLSGQSNMVGCGNAEKLETKPVYKNVRLYVASNGEPSIRTITPLTPDGNTSIQNSNMFGPEIGIAEFLSPMYPNETIIFIKVAWGGTDLYDEWLEKTRKKQLDAAGNIIGYEPYTLYEWFCARVDEALIKLVPPRSRNTYTLAGCIWLQGEADANFEHMATSYSASLTRFAAKIRSRGSKWANLPFIYGVIRNSPLPYQNQWSRQELWPLGKLVQNEQYRAQSLIPKCRCTDVSSSPDAAVWQSFDGSEFGRADFTYAHYNTQGMMVVGRALGKAMKEYIQGEKTPGCASPKYHLTHLIDIVD